MTRSKSDNLRRGSSYVVGLVKVPRPSQHWKSSGEGGVEFWFVLRPPGRETLTGVRDICVTGFQPAILYADSIVTSGFSDYLYDQEKPERWHGVSRRGRGAMVELAVCVGATGLTLWNEKEGRYWEPTINDLTDEGKHLYRLLTDLYDRSPEIVTALDT